ncbi:MAG: hypothetical protein ACD_79C00395G0002 [uncultured bacterium]|nr:MAG: hypothetical protein ACD_79C00395G0002 [uncultured bacterium]
MMNKCCKEWIAEKYWSIEHLSKFPNDEVSNPEKMVRLIDFCPICGEKLVSMKEFLKNYQPTDYRDFEEKNKPVKAKKKTKKTE